MAKNDNLKDFVTDLADAIREKKGTTDLINPQNFADEIRNLPSGGEVNAFGEEMVDNGGGIKQVKAIRIADGVTSIRNSAYYYVNQLLTVNIPDSVIEIGNAAFQRSENLLAIRFPPLITEIPGACMSGCLALADVYIPDGVTKIGQYAFQNCGSLESLAFPSDLTKIGQSAFQNCESLLVCDFRKAKSVPTLDNVSAFSTVNNACRFIVPDALYDEWIAATNWATFADRIVKSSEYTE